MCPRIICLQSRGIFLSLPLSFHLPPGVSAASRVSALALTRDLGITDKRALGMTQADVDGALGLCQAELLQSTLEALLEWCLLCTEAEADAMGTVATRMLSPQAKTLFGHLHESRRLFKPKHGGAPRVGKARRAVDVPQIDFTLCQQASAAPA
eukprot:6197597-Pleurochrysis_carterae.AAC.2